MKAVMKTKEQVLRYISQCEFDDADWQKVLDYCRQNFGGGKAHRSIKPLPNSRSTYAQFLDWIDNGIGVGDIVRYGHTIGIVGAYTPGYARMAAYLSIEGNLICNTIEMAKDKIYRANDDEIDMMKGKLMDNAYEFSVSLSCCVKFYQPKDGEIVRVNNGGSSAIAIYHCSDAQCVNFYAYLENENVTQDKKCTNVRMFPSTKRDVQRLFSTLTKNKLEWQVRKKELRKVSMVRAAQYGRYWYLSDRFSICSDIDKYTKLHEERFQSGNYFVSYQAAILFAQRVQELRKEIAGD